MLFASCLFQSLQGFSLLTTSVGQMPAGYGSDATCPREKQLLAAAWLDPAAGQARTSPHFLSHVRRCRVSPLVVFPGNFTQLKDPVQAFQSHTAAGPVDQSMAQLNHQGKAHVDCKVNILARVRKSSRIWLAG